MKMQPFIKIMRTFFKIEALIRYFPKTETGEDITEAGISAVE
jgi:hypothetical protein